MTAKLNRKGFRWEWLLGLLLVAVTVLAYQPAWRAGFIWDDDKYVTANALLTAPDGLMRIWFSTESPSQYFPLTYTTFRLERWAWGLNAGGYHWVNILMHAVNALLVWRLLRRLDLSGAWLVAAVFALHPVNVESVAWVTELKNVQSMFFMLLAALAWLRFVERPGAPKWYWIALFAYALALLSKTTACTLPAALWLILWLRHEAIDRRRWMQLVPFVILGLAMGVVSMWWERHHQGTEGEVFGLGFGQRILLASRAIWFYLGKLIWPANLTFSYPRWTINPAEPGAYVGVVAGLVVVGIVWLARRFVGRGIEVAMLFYVATLAPMLGFVMLYTFHYTFVADHYQYVAMIGPVAFLVAMAAMVLRSLGPGARYVKPVLGGGVLAVLAIMTWNQCGMYADAETLWRTTLERNPASFMAHNNLGELLLKQGRRREAISHFEATLRLQPASVQARCNLGAALTEAGQLEEAVAQYRKVLELRSDVAEVHRNLSDVFLRLGRLDEAVRSARRAVEIRPAFAEAQNSLGNALLQKGEPLPAITHLQKAVDLQPNFPNALNNLGVALVQVGKAPAALALFQRAVALRPDFAEAHNNLGRLELQKGNVAAAVESYEKALQIDSENPDTLANLAWVLATAPDARLRNGSRAIELARRADALTGDSQPGILGTLAAAYAEAGRYAEAVGAAERALKLARDQSDEPLIAMLQRQLNLHRAASPLRDSSLADNSTHLAVP